MSLGLLALMCVPSPARAVGAGGAAELRAALAAKPDPARGETLYETCQACHGRDGEGARDGTVPAIGGQHYEVLVAQLVAFRHDGRRDIRMEHFADRDHLSGAQAIADVAAAVARRDRPARAGIGDGVDLGRGTRAYVTYCAGCHGTSGQGDAKRRIPRLATQHYEYLLRQIEDTAAQRRPNMRADHAMLLRGGPLAAQDLRGIADYLSRMMR